MKSLTRFLLIVALAAALYFGTIGRNDFYRLLDAVQDFIQVIADNYRKK